MNSKFARGFVFAFRGFSYAFRTQVNMRFHVFTAVAVLLLSAFLRLSITEWCVILLCIGSVFSAELINTSIETGTDITSPAYNEKAGRVKDVAAAAVLVVCVLSAVIGLIIFIPKIIRLFAV